jgi:cell wall-associated NlpC family hydrolase
VERLPNGRHHQHHSPRRVTSRYSRTGSTKGTGGTSSPGRPAAWTRIVVVAGALALAGVLIPAGVAGAARAAPTAPKAGTPASLKATLAKVKKIENQIEALSEQYNALKIQLQQARREVAIARKTIRRDEKLLASGKDSIGQIAAQGYMTGTVDPTLQLLQTSDPQQYLDQASIMQQLQKENSDKISVVQTAQDAAKRARLAAQQEQATAIKLTAQMRKKVGAMRAKQKLLDSSAFKQAMDIYNKTGTYPVVSPTGDSIPAQMLRYALTKQGDPYVWAAAGPSAFDCSGLVVWAYAQIGISVPHFTGDLWNMGVHIAKADLQAGDLVFMYGIDHVGIYMGNGLMLNAPHTGAVVRVEPVHWNSYDGAVRIG